MRGGAVFEAHVTRVLERAALHATEALGVDREGPAIGVDGHVRGAIGRRWQGREPRHVGSLDALSSSGVNEQGHIGEVLAEGLVIEAIVDDDLGDCQRKGRIRIGLEAHPFGRLLGGCRVVGIEVDHLAAVLTRDVEKVRIGKARDHDIRAKNHRVLGVFPAVRLELLALHAKGLGPEHGEVTVHLVAADGRPPHHVGKTNDRTLLDMTSALHLPNHAHGLRPVLVHDVTQLGRSRVECRVPVGLLHLARLIVLDERLGEPMRPV